MELISGVIAAIIVLSVLLVLGTTTRSSGSSNDFILRKRRKADEPIKYNLSSINLPRMNGWRIRLFAKFISSKIGNMTMNSKLFSQAHMDMFRNITIEDEPTLTCNPQLFDGPPATVDEPSDVNQEVLILPARNDSSVDFWFKSISDYYHAYRKNSTNPMLVAEWVLSKIEESDKNEPKLRSVTQSDREQVLMLAEESKQRFLKGDELSFLDGVPVLIKEELNCTPYHTRCGTCYFGEEKAAADCTIVRKLKDAGAVVIGMTNMHELGMGVTGINSNQQGTARNPYNPNHVTGGSSSGSAAAVAAGLVPVAIGTDGGGSVRIPAALCGMVGLKATWGRVSFGGCSSTCSTTVHCGPICNNVLDAALVYSFLAGPDEDDQFTLRQPKVTLERMISLKDMGSVRMGIDWTWFRDATSEVVEYCEKAVNFLSSKGATVHEIHVPELEETRVAHSIVICSEFRNGYKEKYDSRGDELMPESQTILENMKMCTSSDFLDACRQRTRSSYFLSEIFKEVNVIITPACGCTAPGIDPVDLASGLSYMPITVALMRYMSIGNLTGVPSIVVPVGYSSEGLPVCLQITGSWWQEDLVLAVAKQLEELLPTKEIPQIFFSNNDV